MLEVTLKSLCWCLLGSENSYIKLPTLGSISFFWFRMANCSFLSRLMLRRRTTIVLFGKYQSTLHSLYRRINIFEIAFSAKPYLKTLEDTPVCLNSVYLLIVLKLSNGTFNIQRKEWMQMWLVTKLWLDMNIIVFQVHKNCISWS